EDDASVTFTATLSQASQGDTTIVTTLGNIVIADGQTVGTLVIATQDSDVYLDAGSLSATITGASGGNFESLVIGTASATAQIADTLDTTTVTLDDAIAGGTPGTATITAHVNHAVTGSDLLITLSNGAVITIAVGASSGVSSSFAALIDNAVSVSSTTGGNYELLDTSDSALVAVNDAPVLTLPAQVPTAANVRDEFGSANYGNNDGTASWSGSWVESNDDGNANSGEIQITGGLLDFDGDIDGVETLTRATDLTGASSATLTFSYSEGMDSGENVVVEAWNGSAWGVLGTISGATADGAGSFTQALNASQIGAHSQIRFRTEGDWDTTGTDDFFRVDDVNIAFSTPNPTYIEGSAAVVLNPSAEVSDDELDAANNYAGATLTLARNGGANAEDVFSGSGLLSLSGGNLVYSGTTVGTYTQVSGTLVITFNDNATSAVADGVLQSLAYANTSNTPPATVTISYSFSDGNAGAQGIGGALLTSGSVTVNVAAVNDAPAGVADKVIINGPSDVGVTLQDAWLVANDSDPEGAALSVATATDGTDMDVTSTAGTTVVFTSGLGSGGSGSFTYTTSDGSLQSGATTVTVTRSSNNAVITGTGGDDILIETRGDDGVALNGGAGRDFIIGGSGTNTIAADQSDFLIDGGGDTDTLQVAANFTSSSDEQIVNIENVTITAAGGVTLDLGSQSEGFVITGSAGADNLKGGAGNDALIGGGGMDTFNVAAGSDSISDLGNGGADVLSVSSGATATATAAAAFTASASTSNAGTASINASGFNVSVASASGPNGWSLSNSSSTAVTLTGSVNSDQVTSSSAGDTINVGLGSDTVTINAGTTARSWTVNLGSDSVTDKMVFNHGSISNSHNTVATVSNFNVAHDQVAVVVSGTNIANGSFQTITADNPVIAAGTEVIEIAINNAARVTATLTGDGSSGTIATIIAAATANFPATGNYTFIIYSDLTGTANAGIYTVNIIDNTAPNADISDMVVEHIMTLNGVGFGNLGAGNFTNDASAAAPAGIAGEPINLALTDLADYIGTVTVTVAGMPVGWSLSEGSDNGDGTWTVVTDDPSRLTVTTATDFSGAIVLPVAMTWINVDGSTGSMLVRDNVEAYAPGSPIFALSQDDNLSGSSGADTFVFAQPIAHNQVYGFDVAADRLDLIGFGAGLGFANLQIADDGQGNAVITLGPDSSITLRGVDAGALGAANFVFDLAPEMSNSGTMMLHDGAMLPVGGFLDNSGSVLLDSHGQTTRLEVLVEHLTLRGGGQVVLSDSPTNLIVGSSPQSRLVNENNTISGAGQLGGGQLMLANAGLILANGLHALLLDTGNNVIDNSGTLAATGAGGMTVASALDNSGHLWANGGDLRLLGDVTGGGSATIDGDGTLAFGGAAQLGSVAFHGDGAGTLAVEADDAMSLGTILGLEQEDGLLLSDLIFGADTRLSYSASADGTGGLLTVSDGTQSAALRLLGHYSEGDFLLAGEADGSVKVGYGGAASGTLVGTMADDDLQGGAGNDILVGRAGSDLLHGGSGADTFAWLQGDLEAGKVTLDYVADFNQGEGDRLDLSDLLDQDGSETMDSLKSLLSMVQETDGIHLQVQDTTTHQVAQDIVLMNHSFGSLTGDASSTASQVIDYLLSNHRLDIDNP
ncbi:beta strand repeat-containing protein, partial [Aeromonas rivipollensis]